MGGVLSGRDSMYVMFEKIQLGSFYAVRIQWATFARGGFCKATCARENSIIGANAAADLLFVSIFCI